MTEADIPSEVVAPDQGGISPEFARAILDTERATLDKYLRVGQFLDLMQAKARLSLEQPDAVN